VTTLEQIATEIRHLSVEERKQLITVIVDSLTEEKSAITRSILEFEGIGERLRTGEDAQDYVNRLRSESDFQEAIQIALQHEALTDARRLVAIGLQDYPESEVLKRYEHALAPPKLISRAPATQNYSKSMRWLSAHSHEHVGHWLALQDGVLLGTAQSREALDAQLGALIQQDDVLVTRIPST
jgi:hypothetical protein